MQIDLPGADAALLNNISRLQSSRFPEHVAIILDGNGRWAQSRGLSRSEGHRAGGEALKRLLDFFLKLQIPAISLYAFSTENWRRPKSEVEALWSLMSDFFTKHVDECREMGIKVRTSGDLSRLPQKSRAEIEKVIHLTSRGKKLTANFCVNYGSQDEILHAIDKIVEQRIELYDNGQRRKARASVRKKEFEKNLYTRGLPDVDLLVRPGGESRVSNFLLWQIAYAEIYVTEQLWPDFTESDMVDALLWFQSRNRRFGGL